jgi:type II pantothenate kinase
VGVDVGGTLAKLCYFSPRRPLPGQRALKQRLDAFLTTRHSFGVSGRRSEELQVESDALGGTLHFFKFDSQRIQSFFQMVREQELGGLRVYATGGGAVKHQEAFIHAIQAGSERAAQEQPHADADAGHHAASEPESEDKGAAKPEGKPAEHAPKAGMGGGAVRLRGGARYAVVDEMAALVRGMDFLIRYAAGECFSFKRYLFHEELEMYTRAPPAFPFLLVNIGSGVSILRVDDQSSYVRVGGSSLGGGTFYGLCRLLTGCASFAEALSLAHQGKGSKVDLLVSDIYGRDYSALGLSGDTIAASFGKLARHKSDVSREDLAKAALVMITNNICSLAHLYARQVLKVPSVVFVGNFLRNNLLAMRMLSYALTYWSSGTIEAIFLKHEGYFGSLGAILQSAEE